MRNVFVSRVESERSISFFSNKDGTLTLIKPVISFFISRAEYRL